MSASKHFSDMFVVRVGGIPIGDVEELKCGELSQRVQSAIHLDHRVKAMAANLTDTLYKSIRGVTGNSTLQNALLNIKRDVFNLRTLSPRSFAATSAAGNPLISELNIWDSLIRRRDADRVEGNNCCRKAFEAGRLRLLQLTRNSPQFRKGLVLSSPSFARQLRAQLHGNNCSVKAREQVERTLLLYVLRAAYKTSPFSTFSPVCLGAFVAGDDEQVQAIFSKGEVSSIRTNLAIRAQLRKAVSSKATKFPNLRVRFKEHQELSTERIVYWKRREVAISSRGPIGTIVSESPFHIRLTPTLRILRDRMRAVGSSSIAELQQLLTEHLGMHSADAGSYLQLLVENDLLFIDGLRRSDFSPENDATFVAAIRRAHDPVLAEIAEAIDGAEAAKQALVLADPEQRAEIVDSLQTRLDSALGQFGAEVRRFGSLFYEDVALNGARIELREAHWSSVRTVLCEWQRIVSVFDPLAISRITLQALTRKTFGIGGRCRDIIAFAQLFQETFFRSFLRTARVMQRNGVSEEVFSDPWRLKGIEALKRDRELVFDSLKRAMQCVSGQETVFILPSDLKQSHSESHSTYRHLSNSFFVQLAHESSDVLIVLNRIYGGCGASYSRFAHLFTGDDPAASVRRNLRFLAFDDAIVAEIQGGVDTNLNQHALMSEYEIVIPGEIATTPTRRQIAVNDLELRHDPVSDAIALYSASLNRPVVPVYLGAMYPLALPDLQLFLLHFAPPILFSHPKFGNAPALEDRVVFSPRICYKNLVIERASWIAPIGLLPQCKARDFDFSHFVLWEQWRLQAGLPDEVFYTFVGKLQWLGSDEGLGEYDNHDKNNKPVYLDFKNPFCVKLLESSLLGRDGYVRFVEMLPTSRQSILHHNGAKCVSEFVFECTQLI